jgi:hypothetical protein
MWRGSRRKSSGALILAAAFAAAALPVRASDCTAKASHEMDIINRRAAAADHNRGTASLCRDMAAQIHSYDYIIGLFRDPGCGASDPKGGIALLTSKVTPLREAYAKYCR